MTFQAYLDNVEDKSGKTPQQFIDEAKAKGLKEHRDIVAWLKENDGLGLGHARALDHVIRRPEASKGLRLTAKNEGSS